MCHENKHMYDGFQNYKYLSNQKWLFPQVKIARNIIRKWKNDRISSDIYMEAKCFGRESLIWIFVPLEVIGGNNNRQTGGIIFGITISDNI